MAHQSNLIADNIEQYLHEHENKDLLRFITCGSVDDGKSTLIGRLLHDSKMIFEDQLAAITAASKTSGTTGDTVDLALLVDGLQSEREQGITIDVAYRFFSTDKRKFIVADTPGHEQYTRNMVTGASNADAAILMVDAAGKKMLFDVPHYKYPFFRRYLEKRAYKNYLKIYRSSEEPVQSAQEIWQKLRLSY